MVWDAISFPRPANCASGQPGTRKSIGLACKETNSREWRLGHVIASS